MTSFSRDVARNFSRENMPMHAKRYAVAHEFLEVNCTLWEGWQEGGQPDKASGRYFVDEKIQAVNHRGKGEHFQTLRIG